MARAAIRRRLTGPLPWRVAHLVGRRAETATADTLSLRLDDWPGHLPGQHVDLRLTAEDGYSVQRSYSIASAPEDSMLELTVQLLAEGEVSPFLVRDYALGDPIELRGPVGGWFAWEPDDERPVLLIGGGSGVVPLMAMVRTRRALGRTTPFTLLYSVRTPEDVYYRDELERGDDVGVAILYTRRAPPGSRRPPQRLSPNDLPPLTERHPVTYICGPTGFVEAAAGMLVDLGYDPDQIRTERFGPTGA